MRNYLVPPGTTVKVFVCLSQKFAINLITLKTPEIRRLSDGKIIRESQLIVAGPASTSISCTAHTIRTVRRSLLINFCILLLCTIRYGHFLFTIPLSFLFIQIPLPTKLASIATLFISICSMSLAWFMYQLCFILGRNGLHKFSREMCPTENQFFLASLEQGSKASQPSRLHAYFFMRYNIPHSKSGLKVTFQIDPTLQKYWSMVVYDSYGLPLPAYVNDENVKKTVKSNEGEFMNIFHIS